MSHVQYVDELVKEYLLFRGFSQTLKAFDNDLFQIFTFNMKGVSSVVFS